MQKPEIQELSNFVVDYVSTMVSIGTYSSRVSRCAKRIAQSFGYELSLNFSFNHTIINIVDPDDYSKSRTYIVDNEHSRVDFRLISSLSSLSWSIYDHIRDLRVAKRCFNKLRSQKKHPFYMYIILQSIANASFSRLFGGDLGTVLIVFVAGLVGTSLKTLFVRFKLDMRIIYIVCAFISSYLAFVGVKLELTQTAEVALGSSVLYLTPSVFFINSVIDIL